MWNILGKIIFVCIIAAMHELLVTWMNWVAEWGYGGVVLLMAMESSIIPVPSEVVVPPAAIMAAQGQHGMSMGGVVLAGTIGSYIGSCIMYAAALWLGRPLVLRYGKWFFLPQAKVEAAERFMCRYTAPGIFFARFLPVVRHLISIPAGLAKVNFFVFSLATITGSALWCCALAWFGDKIGREHPQLLQSPEHLSDAVRGEMHLLLGGILLLIFLYVLAQYLCRRR